MKSILNQCSFFLIIMGTKFGDFWENWGAGGDGDGSGDFWGNREMGVGANVTSSLSVRKSGRASKVFH